MALTDPQHVRLVGGLNEDTAHETFRLDTAEDLDALITECIEDASAWLQLRAPDDYASENAGVQRMFRRGEACLAMHFLTMPLKERKVLGTHWPLESEGSERFAELIDVEWKAQMETVLEQFLVVTGADKPFAAPVMVLSGAVDRTQVTPVTDQLTDLLDEVNGTNQVPQ